MKKVNMLLLAVIFVFSMFLGACGNSGGASGEGAASAEGSGAGQEASAGDDGRVYTLKLDSVDPVTSVATVGLQRFIDDVHEKSGGRIEIVPFWGATLGAFTDNYDNMLLGVSDIAWSSAPLYAGRMPVYEGGGLPMLGMKNAVAASNMLWDMFETSEELQSDFENVKVLALHSTGFYTIFSAKKPIDQNSFAGSTIRVSGIIPNLFVTALGFTPMTINSNEIYEAVEKNLVDMLSWDWTGLTNYALYEQVKYACNVDYSYGVQYLLMNLDSYNALPDDLKQVIDDCSGAALSSSFGEDWENHRQISRDTCMENGVEIVELSDATVQKWEEAAQTVQQQWIETMNSAGYDGAKIVEDYKALAKKWDEIYPGGLN
jgi:TRAP-type C4-dicarboxylate transport system substrate-binding protein